MSDLEQTLRHLPEVQQLLTRARLGTQVTDQVVGQAIEAIVKHLDSALSDPAPIETAVVVEQPASIDPLTEQADPQPSGRFAG